ncbi:MAG: PAS domain-containing protein [Spartobacteria bacterium]|nr:PAS domain-containing protein [Spartobacteria bacterium]
MPLDPDQNREGSFVDANDMSVRRRQIIGLGGTSGRKNYYPELQNKIRQLEQENLERRRAQDELGALKQDLQNILDSMPSLIAVINDECEVLSWNNAAVQMTGIAVSEAVGYSIVALLDMLPPLESMIHTAVRSMRPCAKSKIQGHPSEGTFSYYDVTVYPLESNKTERLVVRIDDVTNQVRMEGMLIQADKMMALGGVAAGMAHEINNPLAGLLQSLQVLSNRLKQPTRKNIDVAEACGTTLYGVHKYAECRGLHELLDNMSEAGKRISSIIRGMLSFGRQDSGVMQLCCITELVDTAVKIAGNDFNFASHYEFKKIHIVREYASDLPLVMCAASNIQQVVLNILKNGAEAMRSDPGNALPRFILRIRRMRNQVVIDIENNGEPMPESIRAHVFEPFFTTKAPQEGTGLGLSVSYFIVSNQHHGALTIDTSPDFGTRFSIALPAGQPVRSSEM